MTVRDIVESVDLVDYVSQYADMELKSDGDYWCCSPLKDERTPSFSVNRDLNRFYDFSSGAYGNILDFIMKHDHCGFREALEAVKKYANITDSVETGSHHKLLCTSVAQKFKPAVSKLKSGGGQKLPPDYMDRYEYNLQKMLVWQKEGITDEALESFGVKYDSFSDRLVYPVRNLNGDIVNVCGRTLDPLYKEKKIRKYTYFKSWGGCLDVIYGLYEGMDAVKAKKEVILFEGAKSCMLAYGWGIRNTGAILTSHLNPQQFRILIKLGVRVVFALDKDVNIMEDANIAKLRPYVNVEYIWDRDNLLDAKDSPVDKGLEVWQTLYERRRRYR